MKAFIYFAVVIVLLLTIQDIILAQPGLPGGSDGPPQAPIDGGLGLLAAAGGAYAYKKLRDRKIAEEAGDDIEL
jgi:hypothetical protein